MPAIRYGIPYEVVVFGKDNGSGKPVTNKHYYSCGIQNVSPPAFGAPIAGPSDNQTFLTNFSIAWFGDIAPKMNHNYQVLSYQSQAMIGKRYSSPLLPISGVGLGTPVTIQTASPHGLVTGQQVVITGVTSPAVLNAVWVVSVVSPFQFTLNGSSIVGAWSGDGAEQAVSGQIEFLYADKVTSFLNIGNGVVVGDSLPLFCTASIRRLNNGVGRHFRSRFSLSPMSESDVVDGAFTATQKTAMATALGAFVQPIQNGGTDTGSKFMVPLAISRALAFAQPSPFTFVNFTAQVNGMVQQPNCGSLVRRKPKQTTTIA